MPVGEKRFNGSHLYNSHRKRIEAQGDADAIRIRASAISVNGGKEYVELKAIEKWDGKLPTTSAGGVTPFIHVK